MKALTTVMVAVGLAAGALPAGGTSGPVLITAGDLNVGDQVALEGNRVGVVTGTITTRRETDVFNLSVDGDRTFLVTPTPLSVDGRINPARGPPAVVTHNTNCGNADFAASADGVVIPLSRTRLEKGFQEAGLHQGPSRTPGEGIIYTLPDNTRARVMDAKRNHKERVVFSNASNNELDTFTGKQPQAPRHLPRGPRRAYLKGRSHVVLNP